MSAKMHLLKSPTLLLIISLVIAAVAYPTKGLHSRKLDESSGPPGDAKCSPCDQSPPPPSPPPPLYPPPPPPPALPPPSPKKPPSQNCPPPPPSSIIYITGPPGNLYPIDQDFGGSGRKSEVGLLALVGSGLLAVMVI